MDNIPATVSLSLTHISYDPNDPISYICAWLSLVPQGLIIAYVTLCWASREAEIGLAFAGQLACEALNFALKRIIREERPKQIYHTKGYGMPSSHSQFMAFFAVYVGLFVLVRHRPQRRGSSGGRASAPGRLAGILPSQSVQQAVTAFAVFVNAVMVAGSRVYLNYHTPKQVIIGFGIGILFASIWFAATYALRKSGLLQWILDLEAMRLFRIKDLLIFEDLVESGWQTYEDRRARSIRSTVKKSK